MLTLTEILAAFLIGSCACLAAGVIAVRLSTAQRARHQRGLCTRHQDGGDWS
ncbi:hypothetical protein [Kocuria rhizophila]|uniref:hypothetical protein n=1 Tax=Kocuria rhizophila TaxID=72000 RepID=UPI0016423BE9|nr:hypothetical protein [Kocuria rhizophila]MCG7425089.1 hypothetical protein [Kocuria rhizophila]MCT2249407.1 hypothetical protein [Kocuria rhizophila]